MDKVVGWAFGDGLLPLEKQVLCVSGRSSFELVQKAAVAGCPVLVAVGAPSSLAVELAADRGVTLCGWVREGRMTVYTEPWRIVP
jgi:FdhD protein